MATGRTFTSFEFVVYDWKGDRFQYRIYDVNFIPEDVLESIRLFLVNKVVQTGDWVSGGPPSVPGSNNPPGGGGGEFP